jgi:hypothetical protein
MIEIFLILCAGGALAGIVQFFVIFKKLPVCTEPATNSLTTEEEANVSAWKQFWAFLKKYWVFFGYVSMGIAGSLLTPLAYTISSGKLPGLEGIK